MTGDRTTFDTYHAAVRVLIRATIAAMVLTAFSPLLGLAAADTPGGTFVDDDLSEHQAAIEAIAASGITRGCNPPLNSRYCPEASVTRGEMAAFLVRALSLPGTAQGGFTDTGDSVFAGDIDRLAAAKVTTGCNPPDNDRFCPDDPVTRGQMAAFLARALGLGPDSGDHFIDDDGSVFEAAIESVRKAGITVGCNPPENDRYCPDRPVTRAEMATFLSRALGLDSVSVKPRPYQLSVAGRETWGAAAPRGTFTTHTIDQITIHHSDTSSTIVGPPQFRSWQSWHFYLGWPDLAYHFIIGKDAKVYEGRPFTAVGDTATEYDPTGHLLIVVAGNYDQEAPTEAQLEALAQLVAWGSMQFDVDVATVSGHRDHAATTCPGDHLQELIDDGAIAGRAEVIIAEGGVTMEIEQ